MIVIGDTFAIQADDKQYILVERKIKGEGAKADEVGKEYFATLGYFGTIGAACESLVKRLVRLEIQSRDMTLAEAVRALQEVADNVEIWARGLAIGG